MDHIVKNRPGYKLDGLVRVWPNASGLEVSRCVGIIWPTFWQDATGQLPVSHFQTRFRSSTDVPAIILCKTSPNPIYFWPIVPDNFGQTDPVLKQANVVQESSGPLLADAYEPIRTGCESDLAFYWEYM